MTTRKLSPAIALAKDERGAVMVLGVFMCAASVGLLWYLAGIGDALLYRERLQEASDAAAFSSAVLHARGMNLLVLINLIMACILGVRVTLKAVQLALGIAALFAAVIPGLQGLAALCTEAASVTQNVINATREPINTTLRALSRSQKVFASLVPAAAAAGSVQVGLEYRPTVRGAAATNLQGLSGLPVEEESIDRLCFEAGRSVVGLLGMAIPDALQTPAATLVLAKVKNVVGRLVKTGGAFFCELGTGPKTAPDLSPDIAGLAKDGCDQKRAAQKSAFDTQDREYRAACRSLGAACDGPQGLRKLTPEQERRLSLLKSARDDKQSQLAAFDTDRCQKDQQAEAKQRVKSGAPAQVGSGAGMTPKKVSPNWQNGSDAAQLTALAQGDPTTLAAGTEGVRVGAWSTAAGGAGFSIGQQGLAQAEFFFDCAGTWAAADCNGPGQSELALWNFRWRARLRRCNPGVSNAFKAQGVAALLSALSSSTPQTNLALQNQLRRAADEGVIH